MQSEHGQLVCVPRAPPEPLEPLVVGEATGGEATGDEAIGGEVTGDEVTGGGGTRGVGDGALSSGGRLPAMHDNRHATPICIACRANVAITDELYAARTS
jgi:hypothetical protein